MFLEKASMSIGGAAGAAGRGGGTGDAFEAGRPAGAICAGGGVAAANGGVGAGGSGAVDVGLAVSARAEA
jgi:hypothetical protein